ncbi:MAG: hypothetical protein IKN75_05180 [Prevotella sp.]|nr:hypothetical protein [Prevotella sp.]
MRGSIKKVTAGVYEGIDAIENEHLKVLFKAIIEVNKDFYSTPEPQNDSDEAIAQLERVFAYELYHQWSLILEVFNAEKQKDDRRIINGEIGKQLLGVKKYPDMVLHKGHGDIRHQEIVVEIKRKNAIKDDNVAQDIIKLSNFMTEGFLGCSASPYSEGVFILTNGNEDDIKKQLKMIDKKEHLNPNIYCIFCNGEEKLEYITVGEIS